MFETAFESERRAAADPEDPRARLEYQKQRARLGLESFVPRPYQARTIDDCCKFIDEVLEGSRDTRRVWALPCGSGKSLIQLETVARQRAAGRSFWILSPSLEIIKGYLEALGVSVDGGNEALASRAWDLGITTGKRFVNALAAARIPAPVGLVIDEVHQWIGRNTTPETIFAMLPRVPMLGFTATPFRATARGTAEFKETWGPAIEVLTHRQAVEAGFILMPEFHIVPLVDDATVRIVNGELDAVGVTEAYDLQMERLVKLVIEVSATGPTAVSVASTPMAHALASALRAAGVNPAPVLQDTPGAERRRIYEECQAGRAVLIQLRVLSVGADLPALANLIDAQPTMSPVLMLQTFGRPARLDKRDPNKVCRIYCTNRNIERFGWLYDGGPGVQDAVIATQTGFGAPNPRGASRLFGFERLDRFRVFNVERARGGFVSFYNVVSKDTDIKSPIYYEFVIAMHPSGRVRCATRQTGKGLSWEDPRTQWKEQELPAELDGMSTPKARAQGWSENQEKSWRGRAGTVGLNPEPPGSDSRILQAMFAALSCGWRY